MRTDRVCIALVPSLSLVLFCRRKQKTERMFHLNQMNDRRDQKPTMTQHQDFQHATRDRIRATSTSRVRWSTCMLTKYSTLPKSTSIKRIMTSSTMIESLKATSDASERLTLIIQHFGCDSGAIHMLGEDGMLHLKANGPGMPDFVLEKIRMIPVGKGMAGLCIERNEPVDSCNLQTDTTGNVQEGAKPTGLQGSIVVPIRSATDSAAIGTLGIATMKERTFTETEINELLEYASIIA